MSLWLYEPRELEGISDEDKELLNREIQQYIDTDPIVRGIMIVSRDVPEREGDNPFMRALIYAQAGLKRYLKGRLQPLYNRIKSRTQPPGQVGP